MALTISDPQITVGQWVFEKPARARICEWLGIDYCCGGRLPLAEACVRKGLDPATVVLMLEAAEAITESSAAVFDPSGMSMTTLADHIEATHHAFLKQELPRLNALADKVAERHGDVYPWLRELRRVFALFADELICHMMKEEVVLFPMIKALESGVSDASITHFGRPLEQPIACMIAEHEDAGEALKQLRTLSGDYLPPQGACNSLRTLLDGLERLERDMHQHVHLENNVLFPRALQYATHQSG